MPWPWPTRRRWNSGAPSFSPRACRHRPSRTRGSSRASSPGTRTANRSSSLRQGPASATHRRGGRDVEGPHQNQPIRVAGAPLNEARGAMVMLHGRGATAESILSLVPALGVPDFAYLAPQAGGNSWWPQSFLAPIPSNEPGISSAMLAVEGALARIAAGGVPPERTVLLG